MSPTPTSILMLKLSRSRILDRVGCDTYRFSVFGAPTRPQSPMLFHHADSRDHLSVSLVFPLWSNFLLKCFLMLSRKNTAESLVLEQYYTLRSWARSGVSMRWPNTRVSDSQSVCDQLEEGCNGNRVSRFHHRQEATFVINSLHSSGNEDVYKAGPRR